MSLVCNAVFVPSESYGLVINTAEQTPAVAPFAPFA